MISAALERGDSKEALRLSTVFGISTDKLALRRGWGEQRTNPADSLLQLAKLAAEIKGEMSISVAAAVSRPDTLGESAKDISPEQG